MSDVKECLTDMEFMNLEDMRPNSAERQDALKHLQICELCRQKLADINSSPDVDEMNIEVPANVVRHTNRIIHVLCMTKQFKIWLRSTHLWLGIFCLFIIASFVFPKYFLQCLLVALITGGKWLIESRTSKNNLTIISKYSSADDSSEKSRVDVKNHIDME